MIDPARLGPKLRALGLERWAQTIEQQLQLVLRDAPHGDWPRWQQALTRLPALGPGYILCGDGAVALLPEHDLSPEQSAQLRAELQTLHPWRKGPYRIADLLIDTEWRSDWKWDRLLPHIDDLQDRLILDVGCGNGYHCWRMAAAGARQVIGIDPTALFNAQFLAIRQLAKPMNPAMVERIEVLPLGIEGLPPRQGQFDTVFSMGVLYHRRSPIDHLTELHGALRRGGQLVLETLVINDEADRLLVPRGRYAKMRNVWFIPSPAMLEAWLSRCGYRTVRTVDITATTIEEQRSTEWMRFESLADFLDPADTRLTIEGYPAPQRAILVAQA